MTIYVGGQRTYFFISTPRNFSKTRFRRFPTFHFSTPPKIFRRKFWFENFVFRQKGVLFEDLGPNGPQNQLPCQNLLQIDLSRGLYVQKSSKTDRLKILPSVVTLNCPFNFSQPFAKSRVRYFAGMLIGVRDEFGVGDGAGHPLQLHATKWLSIHFSTSHVCE